MKGRYGNSLIGSNVYGRPAGSTVRTGVARGSSKPETFKDFSAKELYCPKCKQAMPVREKLLLVLPDGQLFDYTCTRCSTSVGSRKA